MEGLNLTKLLTTLEDQIIDMALRAHDNNVTRAALSLGINRTTLVEKLKRSNFPRPFEVTMDPDGEFTYTKDGKGYAILYKGEKIAHRRTKQAVDAFIKEKLS